MAGGSLAVGVVALIGGVAGNTERVTRYWTAAELNADGSARVTEVIDYEFGAVAQDRHGIFRWVPGLDPAAAIEVSSPDAPDDVSVTSESHPRTDGTPVSGVNIRIGD